jgi:hypothetical protein
LICAGLALVVGACHDDPAAHKASAEGPLLLHASYRDGESTMVLVLPEAGQSRLPQADCTVPLLVDTRTGQVRVLSSAEVQARLRTMQLAGATRSACPRN